MTDRMADRDIKAWMKRVNADLAELKRGRIRRPSGGIPDPLSVNTLTVNSELNLPPGAELKVEGHAEIGTLDVGPGGIYVDGLETTGYKLTPKHANDLPSSYPYGTSMFSVVPALGWPSNWGTTVTHGSGFDRMFQLHAAHNGGNLWFRGSRSGGILDEWAPWREILTLDDTGWKPISLASGYAQYLGNPPEYRLIRGILYLRGAVTPTSGNLPVSGQNVFTNAIPELVGKTSNSDEYNVAPCFGPTGGTIMRVYVNRYGELVFGGSDRYGNGAASYVSLAGASGKFVFI